MNAKGKKLNFFLVLAEGELHDDRADWHNSGVFVHLGVVGGGDIS